MPYPSNKPKCTAHNTEGQPCGNYPIKGATVCRYHGGSAPQVREKAMARILAAADPVAEEMIRIALEGESEAVRVRALADLLDRAGVGEARKLAVELAAAWAPPTVEEAERAEAALGEGR